MANIPTGTKFLGLSSSYPTVEKKSVLKNSAQEYYTIEDIYNLSEVDLDDYKVHLLDGEFRLGGFSVGTPLVNSSAPLPPGISIVSFGLFEYEHVEQSEYVPDLVLSETEVNEPRLSFDGTWISINQDFDAWEDSGLRIRTGNKITIEDIGTFTVSDVDYSLFPNFRFKTSVLTYKDFSGKRFKLFDVSIKRLVGIYYNEGVNFTVSSGGFRKTLDFGSVYPVSSDSYSDVVGLDGSNLAVIAFPYSYLEAKGLSDYDGLSIISYNESNELRWNLLVDTIGCYLNKR